jgi:hypothetical protein
MAGLKFSQFSGMAPRINPRLRSAQIAEIALDVCLDEGTLAPWRERLPVYTSANDPVLAMIRVDCCWLTSDKCADFCVPWPSCPYVVKAGDGVPLYATFEDACADDWCPLTWPCPTVAPSASPTSAFPSVEERDFETRSYRYAWVNRYDHEHGGSPPSAPIQTHDGDSVVIQLPQPPSGFCITSIRLYRTGTPFETGGEKSNPANTEWFLVGEYPVGTTVVTDDLMMRDLPGTNGALATFMGDERLPPPDDIIEVVSLENGQMAAISPSLNQVVMSEPFLPTSWPMKYRKGFWQDDDPVALAAEGAILYVGTTGHPYTIQATQQDSNTDGRHGVYKHREPLPCLNRRSMAAGSGACYYASLDGLVALSGTQARVISEEILSKKQWQAWHPNRMIGVVYDGFYMGFSDVIGFRMRTAQPEHIDARTAMLTLLSDRPNALWLSDHGSLYMANENIVSQWNAGNTLRPYHWCSTEFQWARRTALGASYLLQDDVGPVQVTLVTEKGDYSFSPLDEDAHPLPTWLNVVETAVCFDGTGEVTEFSIGTTIKETIRAGAQV